MPAWPRLLALDPNRNIFSTPEWNRLWWKEFHAGETVVAIGETPP